MTDIPGMPTQVRKPRGEYAKTKARRIEILDAALEVFAESGYRAGSLRDVAARVGISEAGLLHHFPNKVKLLEAVLDRRDDLSRDMVDVDSPDGVATLQGLIDLAAYNASVPGVVELYCILSAEATSADHPAHAYFANRYVFTREMIRIAFEKLARDGHLLTGVDPERAAVATVALWDGMQVQWLLDRSVVDMAEQLREFLAGFVDAELKPASRPDTVEGADQPAGELEGVAS